MRFRSPGRNFLLLYALAYAGIFVSFMPFVMVLLPLKAAVVGGTGAVPLLSAGALGGAAVASVANILFGALSDRSRRRTGTRRRWIGVGLAILLAGYLLFLFAADAATLLAAVFLLQLGINAMFAPVAAIMADEVPDDRKGLVAGLLGVAQPVGSITAVLVTLPGLGPEASRYGLLCAMMVVMIVPFVVLARESAEQCLISEAPPAPLQARRRTDFALAWAAKMLVQVAGNGLTTYGFFYFLSILDTAESVKGSAEANPVVIVMAGANLVAVVLTATLGRVSDRRMQRKPFLAAGALAMAGGMAAMAFAPNWAVAALGYAVATCGVSVFLAIHSALAMQLLPSASHRGRDLGILNLTNTFPAMLAPLLALVLEPQAMGYSAWLLILAAAPLLGGAAALAVRTEA